MKLESRVAVVTGSVRGLGWEIVQAYADEGAKVTICDLVAAEVEKAVARLQISESRVLGVKADVTRELDVTELFEKVTRQFGKLDILVNNAAIIINKPLLDMSLDDWNGIQAVNATGAFLFSREAMRAMVPAKAGAIVNVGSYACYQAFPQIAAYAASKGALAQLTRALSLEAIEHGIRVNAVGSGDVITNITNHIHADGPAFLAEHGQKAPIRRAAQPSEIAEVIAFLASEKASFIVGAVVMADGGMSVALP